jgi:zinc transporter ZupT
LPFTAGAFIYISASDLIPQIKEEFLLKKSVINFLLFLAGIAMMFLMKVFLGE